MTAELKEYAHHKYTLTMLLNIVLKLILQINYIFLAKHNVTFHTFNLEYQDSPFTKKQVYFWNTINKHRLLVKRNISLLRNIERALSSRMTAFQCNL